MIMCPFVLQNTYSNLVKGTIVEVYKYHTYGMVGVNEIAVCKFLPASSSLFSCCRNKRNGNAKDEWVAVLYTDLIAI